MDFVERVLRSFCGSNGITLRFRVLGLIGEKQGAPCFHHVPGDVIREHAQEDMSLNALLEPVPDGSDFEIDSLE